MAQKLKRQILNFILLLLIFVPRLLNLDVFLTADEPLVLEHARAFAAGMARGDFSQTLGIGWPGVTVAGWAAVVTGPAATGIDGYVAGRLVTALANGLLLVAIYRLARLLLGRWPAFLGVALLALDPYTLAYSRLLHIAAPLTLFMTLAGLSYLLWLHRGRRRWLALTGLFTGLALLTKSTALLLGPMLGVILLGWGLPAPRPRAGWWRKQLAGLVIVAVLAGAVFFALWPAMWSDPASAVSHTFRRLLTDQAAGAGNLGLFWLGRFVEDPGPLFYPVAFLLKSTPWLLAGLILNLVLLFHSKLKTQNSKLTIQNSKFLWLFALTYLALMTLASKKSVRYMLPAFPTFYLLTGLAMTEFARRCCRIVAGYYHSQFTVHNSPFTIGRLLFVCAILVQVAVAGFYHPYYFTYYNPLLLGWRLAPHTLLVGWGEGLDRAAAYLNTRPAGDVSAWYAYLFRVFYTGPVRETTPDGLLTADKAVLYINQVQRNIPNPNIVDYFRTRRRPEYTVRLAGIDYAWVYPGPVAGSRPDPAAQVPLSAGFGGELHLLGYDLHPAPRSGSPLVVTLYWRVQTPPPGDRFIFVRLLDAGGRVWAAADSPPVMGLWPVDRWQSGQLIEDAQLLHIPPGTPPETYRLEIGLYDPSTAAPLPVDGPSVGPGGGLLAGEVQVEWQTRTTPPDLPHPAAAQLSPDVRLAGYGDLPAQATTGDLLDIRLAWQAAWTLRALWEPSANQVLFEWRRQGQTLHEQREQLPLPVENWGRRGVLLSRHTVIAPPMLEPGRYELTVALHNGQARTGDRFRLAQVELAAPPRRFDLPPDALPPAGAPELANGVRLAGYTLADAGNGQVDLHLYWQTRGPLTTRYKVFAQLLDGGSTVVAQSDSFPAGGTRPTTGWLPGEVVSDTHTLHLPPDLPPGSYRLIAGLYNPVTGQRVALENPTGSPFPDAVWVGNWEIGD